MAVFDVIFKGLVRGQDFLFHSGFKSLFETVVKVLFILLLPWPFLVQSLQLCTVVMYGKIQVSHSDSHSVNFPGGKIKVSFILFL